MDQPENPIIPATPVASDQALREELNSLRSTLNILLFAMACVIVAIALYFYRQVVNMNRQVTDGKRMVMEFQTNAMPRISWFVENLKAFGKTNQDFNPILAKYNLLQTTSPTAPAATGAPPHISMPKK